MADMTVIITTWAADGAVMEERRVYCSNRDQIAGIIDAVRCEFPLAEYFISDQTKAGKDKPVIV